MKKSKGSMAPLFGDLAVDKAASQAAPQATVQDEPRVVARVDPIEEMVGALCDPIIVYPGGGWEKELPEGLKKELPLHRLAHNMRCHQGTASWDEACDAETLLYLYPASLVAPMPLHWVHIYLYLGYKVMGSRMPEDVAQKTLDDYEMGMLRDLKRWIQRKKLEARRDRRRGEKAEKPVKQEAAVAEYEQIKLL